MNLLVLYFFFGGCILFASAAPQNCASTEGFSCARNNPCAPSLCVEGKTSYPGEDDRRYVTCQGEDSSQCRGWVCPMDTQWNDETERCEINGQEARCAFHTYNCDMKHRNPCYPTNCFWYIDYFLGTARNKYISCGDDHSCNTHYCPSGQWWNTVLNECRPKSEMTGCQDTFTEYKNAGMQSNGQELRSHDSLEGCCASCLSVDLCVGFNYFSNNVGNAPNCFRFLGYAWDLRTGLPDGFDVYVRDGCPPSLEKYYFDV